MVIYMRYYIIFGATLIIAMILLFYPKKYMKVYNNKVIIDFSTIENTEDELWNYDLDNDCLILDNNTSKKWVFTINNDGITNITFYYDRRNDNQKYKIEYRFKVKENKIYWIYGNGEGMFDFPNPI